ncbi:DUF4328 domain-containing protein [Plantactinospora sp. CA-290183]|uniref:DUF4328 domain-containing protein n=1 Tax=Plantactinospora sp. CA-290183 TaxID=3240006 RepID=UPI003D904CE7
MRCHTCAAEVAAGRSDCDTCFTPVGQPPVRPDVRTYSVRVPGLAASVAVALAMLAAAAALLSPALGARLARRAERDGDIAALDQAAYLETVLGLGQIALVLAAAVLVIIWFYRAYRNLDAFPGAGSRLAAGWAIGGWFVPVVNLVVPFRVMADVARGSLWRLTTPALVWVWWLSYLVYLGADRLVARADLAAYMALPHPSRPGGFAAYVDYYDRALLVNLVPLVAGVVAAASFVLLALRISRAQEARIDLARPSAPVMPGMAVEAVSPARSG